MPLRRLALAGIALCLLGLASNIVGIARLEPRVLGTYLNRTVDAEPGDVAVAAEVVGDRWIVAGTTLLAVGVAVLGAGALRRS
jgi:hypothetical protein